MHSQDARRSIHEVADHRDGSIVGRVQFQMCSRGLQVWQGRVKVRSRTARIVVHHCASPRSTTLEQITGWHKARGFETVGYHFFVDGVGVMHRGRDIHKIGAHAKGANEDSIGICLAGDNTQLEHRWTSYQIDELRLLVATLQDVYGPLPIYGHRDVPGGETATTCPGLDIRTVL